MKRYKLQEDAHAWLRDNACRMTLSDSLLETSGILGVSEIYNKKDKDGSQIGFHEGHEYVIVFGDWYIGFSPSHCDNENLEVEQIFDMIGHDCKMIESFKKEISQFGFLPADRLASYYGYVPERLHNILYDFFSHEPNAPKIYKYDYNSNKYFHFNDQIEEWSVPTDRGGYPTYGIREQDVPALKKVLGVKESVLENVEQAFLENKSI